MVIRDHGYPRSCVPSKRMHLEAQVNTAKMHNLEILKTSMTTNNSAGKQHSLYSVLILFALEEKNPNKTGKPFIIQKSMQLDQIGISDGR